jgi:glycosyltransferase involved in cell wall biosynthesis
MKLLITSHVIHYQHGGRLYAYGPYAREIDQWADLFTEIEIASPCRRQEPPGDCLPFERGNIRIVPQKEAGGKTIAAKLGLIASVPAMAFGLMRAMRRADAIHVRCPGNLGLIGVLMAPLFSRRLIAKYAAQWNGGEGEPLSARLQRAILRSRWWRGPVTVYGAWPGSPRHVIPFFTSLLTAEQLERARASAMRERRGPGLRMLYTGRLSKAKNVDVLLRGAARVRAAGHDASVTVVGVGPERSSLEELAESLGIAAHVEFTGGLPFEDVIGHLEAADVLVLASETEGWPKSIAEGMAFGLACVGSNIGFVPQMLEGRGFTVAPRDEDALVAALLAVAESPDRLAPMRHAAATWAQRYSLEGLRDALRDLMKEWWEPAGPAWPAARASGEFAE